ncbi:MAG: tRNA (adenosine(37)-N6)-dimethylallyltransferase MiaA [Paraperlucidibaca sp.]
MPHALCIMGPTAAGKTALAMALVERGIGEIISVDSGMIYRGMDIGTAKPSADELARAPHRLIDIIEPNQTYSAAEFRQDALKAMAEISQAGKVPILVGGTMLYFKVLRDGLANLPEADASLRAELLHDAQTQGWPALHQRLQAIDPVAAARITPHDSQRLQRALEVWMLTGKSLTQWHAEQPEPEPLPYQLHWLALSPPDRGLLHERIAQRFDLMLEQGFVGEVDSLRARGDLTAAMPSMRSVGYRQAWAHLDGEYDGDELRNRGIFATRQLAKRQLTWLRSFTQATWLDPLSADTLPYVEDLLSP